MSTFRAFIIILCLYISGLALYSSLFVLSTNQFALFQIAKAFIASLYCLVFIIPILLAQQSRWLILRVIGYVILIAYFIYAFFLIGYFSYFGFVPEIYALGLASAADMTLCFRALFPAGLWDHRGGSASQHGDFFLSSAPTEIAEKVNLLTGYARNSVRCGLG